DARRDARRLGRRNRPDAIFALVLSEIRGRPRSHPQSDRRARLDRQLSEWLWLAARPVVGRRHRQFPGAAAMECIAGLHQDGGLFRTTARWRGSVTSLIRFLPATSSSNTNI